MGKRASQSSGSLTHPRFWAILGIAVIIAVTAGVTAYIAWPTGSGKRTEDTEKRQVTKDELLAQYRKGDLKSLAPKIEAYLAKHKDDAETKAILASTLLLTGKTEQAVAKYQSLMESKPSADILYQAGIAMGQLGRLKDAIDNLGRASKSAPNVALYHSELARLLAKDKQYDTALGEWQQVLSLTAQDDRYRATIYAEMASIYVAKDQAGAAKEIVANGLRVDPENEYLKSLSKQIESSQPRTGTSVIR